MSHLCWKSVSDYHFGMRCLKSFRNIFKSQQYNSAKTRGTLDFSWELIFVILLKVRLGWFVQSYMDQCRA